jgi:hypothetical protein
VQVVELLSRGTHGNVEKLHKNSNRSFVSMVEFCIDSLRSRRAMEAAPMLQQHAAWDKSARAHDAKMSADGRNRQLCQLLHVPS